MYTLQTVFLTYSIIVIIGDVSSSDYYEKKTLNSFVDVFAQGPSGRPTFGTTGATCWARGGICVRVRHCPLMNFDSTVPGCNRDFRVCCRVFKFGSPTVGVARTKQWLPTYTFYTQGIINAIMKTIADENDNFFHNSV